MNLNFTLIHWLHQPGLSGDNGGVQNPPGSGDDLPAPPVDGVRVQRHIIQIETARTQVLVTQNSLK